MKHPHLRGITIVSLGVFILSFDALMVRLAETTPWNVAFWRGLLIFLVLGILLIIRGSRPDSTLRSFIALAATALISGVGLVLFPLSISLTTTANTVIILTATPFFAAILSYLIFKERVPLRTWIAIAIVFGGLVVIFWGSLTRTAVQGDLIALIAAMNFGLNMTVLRAQPNLSRIAVTCFGGLFSCLICAAFASPFNLSLATMGVLVITGGIQMPAAMVLITTGTRFLPAAEVSLLLLIEALLAPLWVWLVFTEQPPMTTMYGGTVILITLLIHSWLGIRDQSGKSA